MYNLSLHIEYLLLHHDCVVVPGLGAFINVRHAARFDSVRRVWLPMTREVRFNGALSHDDGLLANSYARKNSVSFAEGRELLRRDTMQLREALESDGEITLGHLGILRLEEETVSFQPQQSAAQTARFMGYTAAPVFRQAPQAAAAATVATPEDIAEKVASPIASTIGEIASLAPAPAVVESDDSDAAVEAMPEKKRKPRVFDTDRNYYIAINKIFARTAASFLLIAVVVLSLLPAREKPQVDEASVVPVEKIIRNTAACLYPSESSKVQEAEAEEAPEASADSVKEAEHYRYHVVVATFRSPSEADEFIRQNGGTGYDLHTVNSRTMSRVSAISSDDRADLQSRMMSPEFRMRFGEAWIWEDTTR
ncbi:hypothetical protein [uncultured Alistipes sp.]|uniref:HU domain-containing protein n=1 Tax=uncultured Alistipes sp. TaxID=538949 RepID=UPI002665AC41|nr:hypothetical protein [uncultured Alistipes sp.]